MSERTSIADAEAAGFEVYYAPDDELLLDIDNDDAELQFCKVTKMIEQQYGIRSIIVKRSKSGNKHIRVWLRKSLPVMIRIALQAACGSDPKRELLNVNDILTGVLANPNIFFEIPNAEYVDWKHPLCTDKLFRGPSPNITCLPSLQELYDEGIELCLNEN